MSNYIVTKDSNGTSAGSRYAARPALPPVDVFENPDEVIVVADMPGVLAGSVDVRVENGTLTLEAKRPPAAQDHAAPALAREFDEVDRARTFRIPDGIDTARISAEAKNGTILVRLPKVAAVKPRKIEVRSS